jgi:predicted phage-related endonuclease
MHVIDGRPVGLTDEQRARRANTLGGSDANIIMGGDQGKLLELWQEKTGQLERDGFDDDLHVVMGHWTEPLNRYWFEKKTGNRVAYPGRWVRNPEHSFMSATIDGVTYLDDKRALFEAKHVNAFSTLDEVAQRYMPQLHHNMACLGVQLAALSVIKGTSIYEWYRVEFDLDYFYALLDAETAFWTSIMSGVIPDAIAPPPPPKPVSEFRQVDMAGSNEWAILAERWTNTASFAKTFRAAEKGLKDKVEADVNHAWGYGVQVKRDKAGRLSVRRMSDE